MKSAHILECWIIICYPTVVRYSKYAYCFEKLVRFLNQFSVWNFNSWHVITIIIMGERKLWIAVSSSYTRFWTCPVAWNNHWMHFVISTARFGITKLMEDRHKKIVKYLHHERIPTDLHVFVRIYGKNGNVKNDSIEKSADFLENHFVVVNPWLSRYLNDWCGT